MAMLRDPEHGCPWDLKQSFASIVPYTIEEAYEVADAIEQQDFKELKLELGDLLFQTIFYAQLGQEQALFSFDEITEGICEKLIRRHPHVFSDVSLQTDEQIKANWEHEKNLERQQKSPLNSSVLDDIPKAMPALSRAYKIQKRVASTGFDWPDVSGAIDKVSEEIEEVKQELNDLSSVNNLDAIADELGDLYFALTNVVRHLGLKPEQVVHKANKKFEQRFRHVELLAGEQNKQLSDMSLDEMELLWQQAKQHLAK
ncbi:MAG: nucleoside triphosphate pyrophosphohydrolase [Gammaproteobacteria bacterium]|nr:nucleoside triphosphate pyrophosphohydrolase [Gammaproteobacteria bacterium]